MIEIEEKIRAPKFTSENVDIYRARNENMRGMKVWQPELCVQEILQIVVSLKVI